MVLYHASRTSRTRGIELGARRMFSGSLVDLQYAWLDSDVPTLGQLSKYVLDIARHKAAASVSTTLQAGVVLGGRLGATRRLDGRNYVLLDARLGRRWGPVAVTADIRNLFDEEYEQIVGVAMPGRSARVELSWTR